jgi:hypothetical protein
LRSVFVIIFKHFDGNKKQIYDSDSCDIYWHDTSEIRSHLNVIYCRLIQSVYLFLITFVPRSRFPYIQHKATEQQISIIHKVSITQSSKWIGTGIFLNLWAG